jgi:hypothetical protein
MLDQVLACDCPLAVADTGLEDVHGACDALWRLELPHGSKGIGQQLLVICSVYSHTASLEVHDMEVVAIDQDCISCAAKRWVQGLQTLIEAYFDELFARILDQIVDKVCIALGHCNVVFVGVGRDCMARQNDFREFMDCCADGSSLTGWLIGHEGFEPV